MQVCSSGDHQGTAHRNHYSPNRAATQVSMKYRVKRNQCQDHILEPNQHSRSGQKMNRVKRYPTSGQGQTRHKPVHKPHYPPNSQGSQAVSIRYRSSHQTKEPGPRPKTNQHSRPGMHERKGYTNYKPGSQTTPPKGRRLQKRITSLSNPPPHTHTKHIRNIKHI